jgi:hypothetical protein
MFKFFLRSAMSAFYRCIIVALGLAFYRSILRMQKLSDADLLFAEELATSGTIGPAEHTTGMPDFLKKS